MKKPCNEIHRQRDELPTQWDSHMCVGGGHSYWGQDLGQAVKVKFWRGRSSWSCYFEHAHMVYCMVEVMGRIQLKGPLA